MVTHELGTHIFASKTGAYVGQTGTFGGKTRERPGNRRRVKARTIERSRTTLSGTNHVLVTYPQRRPERGVRPKSALAGILSVDPSLSRAGKG